MKAILKRLFFFSLLVCSCSVFPMQRMWDFLDDTRIRLFGSKFDMNDFQITEPYTPGLMAQYPISSKSTITSTLTAGTYGLSRFLGYKKPGRFGALGALVGLGYGVYKRPRLVDTLLLNPQDAQKEETTIAKKHMPIYKTVGISYNELESSANIYEREYPLFFLSECDSPTCPLTRKYKPELRATFENAVVKELIEKAQRNDDVEYVSFGPGALFQDAVILTKFLSKCPSAKLNIHFLEPENPWFNNYLVFTGSHHVRSRDPKDISNDLQEMKSVLENKGGFRISEEGLTRSVFMGYKIINQLDTYLHKTFPHSQLSFYWHKNADDYLGRVSNGDHRPLDVLAAVDLMDAPDLANGSMKDYINLCLASLEHNKESKNILLGSDKSLITFEAGEDDSVIEWKDPIDEDE